MFCKLPVADGREQSRENGKLGVCVCIVDHLSEDNVLRTYISLTHIRGRDQKYNTYSNPVKNTLYLPLLTVFIFLPPKKHLNSRDIYP